MKEDTIRRRLEHAVSSKGVEGQLVSSKEVKKAERALGRAIVESALEDMTADDTNTMDDICVNCGKACVSVHCGAEECKAVVEKLGLLKGDEK